MQYNFEWDHKKAKINREKHKVSFEHAATVFSDSRAITIFDEEHSENEDRWITIGMTNDGSLLVVNHTFKHVDKGTAILRIISSRKATMNEKKQYMEIIK